MKFFLPVFVLFAAGASAATTRYLDELPLSAIRQGYGSAQANRTVDGKPLVAGGKVYARGIGTHGESVVRLRRAPAAKTPEVRFQALAAVTDEVKGTAASVEFLVLEGDSIRFRSGVMKPGDAPVAVDIPFAGAALDLIVTDGADGIAYDHAAWLDARISVAEGDAPAITLEPYALSSEKIILTPAVEPSPRLTGPRIIGVRPGNPLNHTFTASGEKPVTFFIKGSLPAGVSFDSKKGRLSGSIATPGTNTFTVVAANSLGKSERVFRIVAGEEIALTPPLGWNSWYCFSEGVNDAKIRQVAKAFVDRGLADHGWLYINIDDCWQGTRGGPLNAIQPNANFPDMKALADYVHALGLKFGIYSSPWLSTYAGFIGGSEMHDGSEKALYLPEAERHHPNQVFGRWPGLDRLNVGRTGDRWLFDNDVKQWVEWGVDYVKVDWKPNDIPTTSRIAKALRSCGRDMVLSLSNAAPIQNADGLSSLAQLWRTTGDIHDSWGSISSIGFSQNLRWASFARPGHWNDPDMLQIGAIGTPNTPNPTYRPTRLTPDEQYTQVSLWAVSAAPLLVSCDIAGMDDFTFSLLTNDDVLDVNQDPLGIQGTCIKKEGSLEYWVKPLEGGDIAIAVFNRGFIPATATLRPADYGREGAQILTNLWKRTPEAKAAEHTITIRPHGVYLGRMAGAK